MTVCNMSIEMGARGGMVGIDATTIEYVDSRIELSETRKNAWLDLNSDSKAEFDSTIEFDGSTIAPMITTGTSPDTGIDLTKSIASSKRNNQKGLKYMKIRKNV